MAERRAEKAQKGPRMRSLSDTIETTMITMKQSRYGGAVIPLDWISVKLPISETIVGRKRGREAKLTLLQKFINAKR